MTKDERKLLEQINSLMFILEHEDDLRWYIKDLVAELREKLQKKLS